MGKVTQIRPATFLELQKTTPALMLLDVRSPGEFMSGHIRDAKLLPVNELPRKPEALPADKEHPIVVYCASGARSGQAAFFLSRMGYNNVYDLGGLMGWPYEVVR
ncbi:MAG: rhodanese-like domain-containing protein [Eubacteriales bacterium]|nr:rhodanese-like domain-containing protein [Eubacteriales bacterium]